MPASICRHAVFLVALLLPLCVRLPAVEPESRDEQRQQRLAFMKQKLDEFVLTLESEPDKRLSHTAEPVLRFSNPVRDSFSDGAIFLWLSEDRPVAAASLFIRYNGDFGFDLTSLTDEPLQCVRDGMTFWTPRTGSLVDQPFPEAGAPAASPELRLVQMRRLARRFSGSFNPWPREGLEQFRLLAQPIYRYEDRQSGVVDGAVFALAQANDPEVLLVLEAVRPDGRGKPVWRYSLARMSAVLLKVNLDDREIWSVEGYGKLSHSPNEPYIEIVKEKYAEPDAGSAR